MTIARKLQSAAMLTDPRLIPGCVLWLDGADSSTITDSSGVSQWNDKSASGFNVTASGTQKPSYQTSVQNGRNVVRFDGSANKMTNTSASLLRNVAEATVFIAASVPDYAAMRWFLTVSGPAAALRLYMLTKATDGHVYFGGALVGGQDSPESSVAIGTTFCQLCEVAQYAANIVTGYRNGEQIATQNPWLAATPQNTENSDGQLYVGAIPDGSLLMKGDIGEVIIYNTALSTIARGRVGAYLKNKWGL